MFHLWSQWQSYSPSSKRECRRQEPGYRRLEIFVSFRFTAGSRWSHKAQPTFAIIGKLWKLFIDGRSANSDSQRFTCRRSHLGRFLRLNLTSCVHEGRWNSHHRFLRLHKQQRQTSQQLRLLDPSLDLVLLQDSS